jgi:hypothetical protein
MRLRLLQEARSIRLTQLDNVFDSGIYWTGSDEYPLEPDLTEGVAVSNLIADAGCDGDVI